MAREGKKQPKMKQSAIEREFKRDKKTGYLPMRDNPGQFKKE
jgi:hypothetical protein